MSTPHQHSANVAAPHEAVLGPHLYRASEVDAHSGCHPELVLARNWVRDFLGRPHRDVGRAGHVCPFVAISLALDTIWFASVPGEQPDRAALLTLVAQLRDRFLALEPTAPIDAINKAIVVVFGDLDREHAAELIGGVQKELKPEFVKKGLMIGEFFPGNTTPGLRNAAFRPLDSPVPMIAIRLMVESDLPFLSRDLDTPALRSMYLRAYLRRLGSEAGLKNFDQAVEALVNAEIEHRAFGGDRPQGPTGGQS